MSEPVLPPFGSRPTRIPRASPPETVFSFPGEWLDRRGRAHPKVTIRRIVVLKIDHIGDLLIAARAFELLRDFFPHAHIDLVCGPWNVDLARRLAVFDDVYGVKLSHQVGGQQSNPRIAQAMRRAGIQELEKLNLGPYDLAIDMRHDPDSRMILPAFDALIYAGFGSSPEFPFLDIALPIEAPGSPTDEAYELVLGRQQFHRTTGMIDPAFPRGKGTGEITPIRDSISIDFAVEGAKSPVECGTSSEDTRELGVALIALKLTPLQDGEPISGGWAPLLLRPPHRDLILVSGWASPESWGIWGVGGQPRLRVALPPACTETDIRLDLELQAHVNGGNAAVSCTLLGDFDSPPDPVQFDITRHQRRVSVTASRHDREVKLASEPFRLAAGEYEGVLRVYLPRAVTPGMALTLTLRELDTGTVLMRRKADAPTLRSGLCDIHFDCSIEVGGRTLSAEVEAHDATAFVSAHIDALMLRCVRPIKVHLPPTHTETRLCMLTMRIALELSQEPLFRASSIAERLIAPAPAGGTECAAETVRAILDGWKSAGHCVVGLALGAGKELKKWPRHYFVELARSLIGLGKVKLLFIGGRGDREDAVAACRELGLDADTHALCGAVGLAELGRALQPLDLLIGNDSGPAHYAGRIGIRTIAIFSGCTHPREWGPVGANVSWLHRDEDCAPCYLADIDECRHGHVCIRNLLPSDVMDVVGPEVLGVLSARLSDAT